MDGFGGIGLMFVGFALLLAVAAWGTHLDRVDCRAEGGTYVKANGCDSSRCVGGK